MFGSLEELRSFFDAHPIHKPVIPTGPGLGLGGRMGGVAALSAMQAIGRSGIPGAAVQGSVFRELRPESIADLPGVVDYGNAGVVPLGHTGMTIGGQLREAVQARVAAGCTVPYVADADHMPLFGSARDDLELFRRLAEEAADRTFFTLDGHFCVDGGADTNEGRYGRMLDALRAAAETLAQIKRSSPFVVELSIDECAGVTTPQHLRYLLERIAATGLSRSLFSVAPSIGFTKSEEDGPETRALLRASVPPLMEILRDHGLVLGVHSGDGKSDETLRLIGDLTGGSVWYKVSPDRQRLFFQVLSSSPVRSDRRLLEEYTAEVLRSAPTGEPASRHPSAADANDACFERWAFTLVHRYRARFNELSKEFHELYAARDGRYIANLARQLGIARR